MRLSLKAPIALALGAVFAVGAAAPSLAFGGPDASLRRLSLNVTDGPRIEVRGGARYDQLQNARPQWEDESGLWRNWTYDPRGEGMVADEKVERPDGSL